MCTTYIIVFMFKFLRNMSVNAINHLNSPTDQSYFENKCIRTSQMLICIGHLRSSEHDSESVWGDLRSCISRKLPCDANAARPHFETGNYIPIILQILIVF